MKRVERLAVACVAVVLLAVAANLEAAPLTLEGMGIQMQWTDTEAAINEMPGFVWGNSDTALANSIGLHVLFADGTEGSIAYTNVSSNWNTNGAAFGTLISANGFFASYAGAGLHFLYNVPAGGLLPIAWIANPSTPFGFNVELDYNDNFLNSEFRVTTPGWGSVQITTYSSSAPTPTVPEPASMLAWGLIAGVGAVGYRLRNRKKVAV